MTINQLKYICAVAKAGSINKAAATLFVSQSVVSTAISNFEKEIGHDIFMRSNRGVTLTPFGHTFVSYISSIQTQLNQLDALISRDPGKLEFTLSIATTGYYFLSSICSELFERYRSLGIRIELYEDHESNVMDLVQNQAAEIGIIRIWSCYRNAYLKQLQARKIQYFPVAKLNVAVTVGPKSPLYHHSGNSLTVEELGGCPSVMHTNLDSGPYADIYERLHLPRFKSRIVVSSRSAIYEILANTDCYYLNSAYPFAAFDAEQPSAYADYRTLQLAGSSIQSEIAWIKRESYELSPLANEVIGKMTHFFADGIRL